MYLNDAESQTKSIVDVVTRQQDLKSQSNPPKNILIVEYGLMIMNDINIIMQ